MIFVSRCVFIFPQASVGIENIDSIKLSSRQAKVPRTPETEVYVFLLLLIYLIDNKVSAVDNVATFRALHKTACNRKPHHTKK